MIQLLPADDSIEHDNTEDCICGPTLSCRFEDDAFENEVARRALSGVIVALHHPLTGKPFGWQYMDEYQ